SISVPAVIATPRRAAARRNASARYVRVDIRIRIRAISDRCRGARYRTELVRGGLASTEPWLGQPRDRRGGAAQADDGRWRHPPREPGVRQGVEPAEGRPRIP